MGVSGLAAWRRPTLGREPWLKFTAAPDGAGRIGGKPTTGIVRTGDRLQPLVLTTSDLASLLAPVGEDGSVPRNTYRAGSVFELNLALARLVRFTESQSFLVRAGVFNLTNRANFGVPVRLLEAPAFGRATRTNTPAAYSSI